MFVDSGCIMCPTRYRYPLLNSWDGGLGIVDFIP